MDLSSIYSSQDQINFLIEQTLSLEKGPRDSLATRKTSLTAKKSVLSDLNAKLSTLRNKSRRLTDTFAEYFEAKKATSSNTDALTVSAGNAAAVGTSSIRIERLAATDTRVSQKYADSGTDFSGFGTDQTFSIEVASPTDEDPDNRVSIDVTVAADVFTGTNDEVLSAISDAINNAMTEAVTNDEIENANKVVASVVSEENGQSRLVLRSGASGFTNRMDFGASGLLDTLEVNAGAQSSGDNGGYITNVGSSASDSELNAKFLLNGLTFYRDSNSVTGALPGVTLQLLDDSNTEETITVTSDVAGVKAEVQGFLDSYNESLKFLRDKTQASGESSTRPVLADEYAYRNMISTLRSYVADEVDGVLTNVYNSLYDIGIEGDREGNLRIADASKFTEALETNPQYVSDLFNLEDGFASKIEDYVDNFVKAGGTISSNKKNIDQQITSLNDRISFMDELLERREKQLRDEFSTLQGLM
ncbi:MAG TPA: flagellar filament capping protein FliD, partial [Calditrichia bacterium]|nr:flagellar filament capping protein FliD [Calditrichia bacterium]